MAKATLSISTDEVLKKDAKRLFADLGLDLSSAVNIFLRQAVREQGIPFLISKNVPFESAVANLPEAGRIENGKYMLPKEWDNKEDDAYESLL